MFPAAVTLMAQVNVNERVVLGPGWLLNQSQSRLLGRSAALLHVAVGTGADDIRPGGFAARASWNDVVK